MTIKYALRRVRRFLCRGTSALASHPVLSALGALLLVAITLAWFLPNRFLVLNLSPSVPGRLYVLTDTEPAIGDLVEFRTTNTEFAADYPAAPEVILKPIAAGPGDYIDTTGGSLFINGNQIAPIFTHDTNGDPLPIWRVNRMLESDEFFALSTRVWNSLDSRYLGPIHRDQIIAVRVPMAEWIQRCRIAGAPTSPPPTRE